ncbi:hypothetical protein ACVDG5_008700 [Mesorhizobium sp. ORM6]
MTPRRRKQTGGTKDAKRPARQCSKATDYGLHHQLPDAGEGVGRHVALQDDEQATDETAIGGGNHEAKSY